MSDEEVDLPENQLGDGVWDIPDEGTDDESHGLDEDGFDHTGWKKIGPDYYWKPTDFSNRYWCYHMPHREDILGEEFYHPLAPFQWKKGYQPSLVDRERPSGMYEIGDKVE